MRIVMLTNDSHINQRILIIAETLYQIGHEVIILASANEKLPSFEIKNQIKIERIRDIQSFLSAYQIKLLKNIFSIMPKHFFKLAQKGNKICSIIYLYLIKKVGFKNTIFNSNLFEKACYYRPDIIHIYDYSALRTGVSIKKKLNIPLIYEMHKLNGNPSDISKYILKKETQLIKHAHTCINLVNPQEKEDQKLWLHEAEIIRKIYSELEARLAYSS